MKDVGQTALAQFAGAAGGGRMHHAWLITGPSGIGKLDLATRAANLWLRVDADAQPLDRIIVTRQGKDEKAEAKRLAGEPFEARRNITVDQVRDVQQTMTTRPTMGTRRAIIIDSADDLERGAANALLKSLEEPPEDTIFLLLSDEPGRLLPTIRSRCRLLRIEPVPDVVLDELLLAERPELSAKDRAILVMLAGGAPGRLMRLADPDTTSLALAMARVLDQPRDGEGSDRLLATLRGLSGREAMGDAAGMAARLLASGLGAVGLDGFKARDAAHRECVRLSSEIATYNYDGGLIALRLAGLLRSAATVTDRSHG